MGRSRIQHEPIDVTAQLRQMTLPISQILSVGVTENKLRASDDAARYDSAVTQQSGPR